MLDPNIHICCMSNKIPQTSNIKNYETNNGIVVNTIPNIGLPTITIQ